MARFGGADEIVIRAVECFEHLPEDGGVLVRELNRRDAFLNSGLLHFLAVLIGSGQEKHVLAVQPRKTRQNIGGNCRVGVADMRHAVRIEDWGRDVKLLGHAPAVLVISG